MRPGGDAGADAAARVRERLGKPSDAETRIARGLGEPALFAIALSAVASSIYFALGLVAGDAMGLTPVVYLVAGLFFVVTMLTYVEASSIHPERGGAAVFSRYAFNELWSFIAGWAILLDYLIVMAIGSFVISHYLAAFWSGADNSGTEVLIAGIALAYVAWSNIRGISAGRYRFVLDLALVSVVLFGAIVIIGLFQLFDLSLITDTIDVGNSPAVDELLFAAVIATISCTGIEAASGLAGDLRVGRAGLRRVVVVGSILSLLLFVGMSVVALLAVPVEAGGTELGGRFIEAPVLGVVNELDPRWLADFLRYAVGGVAAMVLIQAVSGQMLGIGRLTYSLGTNRQIPSLLSRLDDKYSTPYVTITLAALVAFALTIPADIEFLAGLFAFGAMLAFTLSHISLIVMRFKEPDRPRPFRVPLNVPFRGGTIPIPAALGALMGGSAWITVLVLHQGARIAGTAWMAFGLALYVTYRRSQGKSLTKRFTIPAEALRETRDVEYGSILVPVFGEALDDDIVGTAGRIASDQAEEGEGGAVLEAVYVFEMPMSLPIDARVQPDRLERAKRALARAKEVGEEYEGVEVATAMVRGRSVGSAIVTEAKRRGVEVIVLAAEEPSRVRGGAAFGGRGLGRDRYAGDTTRYVIEKAPCKVILTAPPANGSAKKGGVRTSSG